MKDTIEEQSYGEVLISLESDGRPALKELGGNESPAVGRRPRELPQGPKGSKPYQSMSTNMENKMILYRLQTFNIHLNLQEMRYQGMQLLQDHCSNFCLSDALGQGCESHFHQRPHQPRGCLQRAECNLGLCTCNCSLTRGKELSTAAGQKQGAGPDKTRWRPDSAAGLVFAACALGNASKASLPYREQGLLRVQARFRKKSARALAGVAQWIECRPANQRVAGLILSQGTCLDCWPGAQQGACERQPHLDVCLPLVLPPFSSL